MDAHQSRRHYGRVSLIIDGVLVSSGQDYYYRSSSRAVLALLTYHDVVSDTNQPLWLLYISIPKNLNIEPNSKPKNTRQDVH